MICPPERIPSDSVEALLASFRARDVDMWTADGRLHYRARMGELSREEIDDLRKFKDQILDRLKRAPGAGSSGTTQERRSSYRAPLSFTQLAHWNFYRLAERRSIRQITSATRIVGRLNIDALGRAIQVLLSRHEALRTRIIIVDGVPVQEIADSGNVAFTVEDWTAELQGDTDPRLQSLIEQFITDPVDLALDPLLKLRVLQVQPEEYVLLLGLEHIVSDGSSLAILTHDLFATYVQALRGEPICLPPIPVKFGAFCQRQRDEEGPWWKSREGYWARRLTGVHRLRFPERLGASTVSRTERGTVPFRIEKDLKAQLHGWSRQRKTTLVLSVLTAYVGLIMRWCGVTDTVLQYVVNGRDSPDLQNTIGYFASPLYLRITLDEQDTFIDLLNRVTEEYFGACEHADSSYLAAQLPIPGFTRNTIFNWIPQASSQIDLTALQGSPDALRFSAIRFANPAPRDFEIDREPFVLLYEVDDAIVGDVYFPLSRFSVCTMERFARSFITFVEALVCQPQSRVGDINISGPTHRLDSPGA